MWYAYPLDQALSDDSEIVHLILILQSEILLPRPQCSTNIYCFCMSSCKLHFYLIGNFFPLQLMIGNMQKEVGYLKYYENEDGDKPIAVGIILGVALPIIAIVVLLAVCVVRRHRKHKPSENYIPDVWKEEGQKDGEEVMLNHVSVKADMNGSIPDDKG